MRAKKRIVKAVLVFVVVGFAAQILFDPLSIFLQFSEILEARLGLHAARKRWESQGVTHYKFDIQGYVPLACIFGGNIEVKDGVVIHTSPRSDGQLTPNLTELEDSPLCNYQTYTMPFFFEELERWLRETPYSVSEISFDTKYGFITSFHFGSSSGHGLLNPTISDCCGGYLIENFQVLEE